MKKVIGVLSLLVVLAACKEKKEKVIDTEVEIVETPVSNEWVSLTNESDWRGYNMEGLPGNWSIKEGVIECFGKAGDVGGDVISTKKYDDFELTFEWKISKGGNSGVFYHVVEKTKAFVFEAGKIILAISVILWVLASYGPTDQMAAARNSVVLPDNPTQVEQSEYNQTLASVEL